MTRSDVIAAAAAARRVACRRRPLLLTAAAWLWWALFPPRGLGDVSRRRGRAGPGAPPAAPRLVPDWRRAARTARVAVLIWVSGLLYGAATPQAFADDIPWGVPTSGDYCRFAPDPGNTGCGVTGLLDPQAGLPIDGTAYGDHGYAGMFWWAYDPG